MSQEELIDNYFENSLSETDVATFNNLLMNDTAFAQEVEFRKNLQAATHLAERVTLKNKLKQFEKPQTKVVKMNNRGVWFAAAVFLLVIASTVWILFQKPDAQKLYLAYYQPYPNVVAPVTRSSTNNTDSLTQLAFALYEAGNYTDAAIAFKKIHANTNATFSLVYYGICNLQNEQPLQAIEALVEATKNNNDYTLIAKWYLAMSYLKNNQPTLSLPLVKEVAGIENPLQSTAITLYEKLKAYR
jgi:tetratricopeptide (TPR) repeat protein